MAYGDFTLERARDTFALELDEDVELFPEPAEHPVSELLQDTLRENVPLATAIHTEKARSELIVAPVLVEVRRITRHGISLFSGIDFNVAPEKGLNGICDFILAGSPTQLVLSAPLMTVVEAKNDNLKSGLGQCVAEMVAARLFNQRHGGGPETIHGAVTTGSLWRFLRLVGPRILIDRTELFLDPVERIVGTLLECVGGVRAVPALR